MVNYSSQTNRLALVSTAALLLGATLALDASAWQRPATPCACAADGVCRPQGPWGHAATKWRPWPGDTLGQDPTTVQEAETRKEFSLPPSERPPITMEGLRGPNISKPPKPTREEADPTEPAEDNMAEPAAPEPEDNLLEGFDLGLPEDHLFVLQPVRVIPRKGIEHAVELLARLDRPASLVISHASGDEGPQYAERIREFARLLDVAVIWAADRVTAERGRLADGRRTYTLADMYDAADLVTYPSLIEGFGNAYLEAVYHRRPIFVNRYAVYEVDIRPHGFRSVEMNGFVTEATLAEIRALLDDPARIKEWTDVNYDLGLRHFSHQTVRRGLRAELMEMFPVV